MAKKKKWHPLEWQIVKYPAPAGSCVADIFAPRFPLLAHGCLNPEKSNADAVGQRVVIACTTTAHASQHRQICTGQPAITDRRRIHDPWTSGGTCAGERWSCRVGRPNRSGVPVFPFQRLVSGTVQYSLVGCGDQGRLASDKQSLSSSYWFFAHFIRPHFALTVPPSCSGPDCFHLTYNLSMAEGSEDFLASRFS